MNEQNINVNNLKINIKQKNQFVIYVILEILI